MSKIICEIGHNHLGNSKFLFEYLKKLDNKIVSGDPEKIKKVLDTWKFSKDSRSSNPNWLLIDTQA